MTPLIVVLLALVVALLPMALGFVLLARGLMRQNDLLSGEILAAHRRATMPVVTVPDSALDQPATPEMLAYLNDAFGTLGNRSTGVGIGDESWGTSGGIPHDPTDALMPEPYAVDGATILGSDDPDWPYPGAGEHR